MYYVTISCFMIVVILILFTDLYSIILDKPEENIISYIVIALLFLFFAIISYLLLR